MSSETETQDKPKAKAASKAKPAASKATAPAKAAKATAKSDDVAHVVTSKAFKTYSANVDTITRKWWVVDAKGQTLGRLATQVAMLLRGKHKPEYTPHVDSGDFVVVINASQIEVTGKKPLQKLYRHHTGYLGHLKSITYRDLHAKHPDRVIEKAVWGMIPHNRLGSAQITKLKVYAGAEHPHAAQQPAPYALMEAAN
jgi:large subunit ribosomal protein L13